MIAAIPLLLMTGASLISMQVHAGSGYEKQEDSDDYKDPKSTTQIHTERASLNQENTCYSGDYCQQAYNGQQATGKDNDASGFNDQSKNTPQHPAAPFLTQPPSQNTNKNPTPAPIPIPNAKTCLECFTSHLTPAQISQLESIVGPIHEFLRFFNAANPIVDTSLASLLTATIDNIDQPTVNSIVESLRNIGLIFDA
jgi:hypothetical protein